MARHHVAFTTAAAAAAAGLVEIKTDANRRVRILEIGMSNTAATAATITVERDTAVGTQTSALTPIAGDTVDPAAGARVATTWSAAPTFSNSPLRRFVLPANIGAAVVWVFGFGDLVVPVSAGLSVVNRGGAATGVMTGWILFEE